VALAAGLALAVRLPLEVGVGLGGIEGSIACYGAGWSPR
jgi:hypothetical protein